MKKITLITFVLLSIVVLFGCRGSQEGRLVGYWKQVPFTAPETTLRTYYWQFYAGNTIVRETYIDNEISDSTDYTYSIDGSILHIFPTTDEQELSYEPGSGEPMGEFWVDLLTKEAMKATRVKHPDGTEDAAFLRIELIKVQ